MSMMNSAEAARLALDEAAQHLDGIIVIYVEPDKNAKPLSFTKRLTLPETDDMQLPFAAGCALAGAPTVLDLHALENASERLAAAVRSIGADRLPPMLVRVSDRHPSAIAGARVIAPQNPRELAGALRYALRSGEVCVVAENPLGAYESCDVPDDWDELFGDALETPHEQAEGGVQYEQAEVPEAIAAEEAESTEEPPHGDEAAPSYAEEAEPADADAFSSSDEPLRDDAAAPAHVEEIESTDANAPFSTEESAQSGDAIPADDEADSAQAMDGAPIDVSEAQSAPSEPAEDRQALSDAEPVKASAGDAAAEPHARLVMPAVRTYRYDPAELERTARLLNVSREALMRLCCRCAEALAEIVIEADAEPGEIACLPPREKAACLWAGADALTLCWDPARLDTDAARALLKNAAANIALPARLILEKS